MCVCVHVCARVSVCVRERELRVCLCACECARECVRESELLDPVSRAPLALQHIYTPLYPASFCNHFLTLLFVTHT